MPQRRRNRDRQFDSPNAGGGTGSDNPTPRKRKPAVEQEPLPTREDGSLLFPDSPEARALPPDDPRMQDTIRGQGLKTSTPILNTVSGFGLLRGAVGLGQGALGLARRAPTSTTNTAVPRPAGVNRTPAVHRNQLPDGRATAPGLHGQPAAGPRVLPRAQQGGATGGAASIRPGPGRTFGASALTGTAAGVGRAMTDPQNTADLQEVAPREDEAPAVDTASIRERFPHISEGGASLLARMEAGETMRQGDFNEAGFAPENANVVPGGRAFTDRPSIDSLRGLTRQQRGQILAERDRRARFEAGDLSAATPGDLRRMRSAFGANAEATMHRELGGGGDRMDRVLHQNRLTPGQRTNNAALLADASQQDAATIREGFGAQQDRQRQDRELDIAQQEADTNRMTTMMRQNPQGQTALNDLITGGLNPETIDQIGQTTFAKIESAFGASLPPEARERLGGHLQGFMRHAMEESRRNFGGNPTAEQLAGDVQAYTDLFTAGAMASAASMASAEAGKNPIEFMKNMFTRGGGARAAASRAIFNPDNPAETARHLEQMAQGIKALQEGTESKFAEEQRTVRRGGRRDRRVILRDSQDNIVQALDFNQIPPAAQNDMIRAYNQIRGLDRN